MAPEQGGESTWRVALPLRLHHWAASKILLLVRGSDQKERFLYSGHYETLDKLFNCPLPCFSQIQSRDAAIFSLVNPPETARTIVTIRCYPNTATWEAKRLPSVA